jgi:hypothetical protein
VQKEHIFVSVLFVGCNVGDVIAVCDGCCVDELVDIVITLSVGIGVALDDIVVALSEGIGVTLVDVVVTLCVGI